MKKKAGRPVRTRFMTDKVIPLSNKERLAIILDQVLDELNVATLLSNGSFYRCTRKPNEERHPDLLDALNILYDKYSRPYRSDIHRCLVQTLCDIICGEESKDETECNS